MAVLLHRTNQRCHRFGFQRPIEDLLVLPPSRRLPNLTRTTTKVIIILMVDPRLVLLVRTSITVEEEEDPMDDIDHV